MKTGKHLRLLERDKKSDYITYNGDNDGIG